MKEHLHQLDETHTAAEKKGCKSKRLLEAQITTETGTLQSDARSWDRSITYSAAHFSLWKCYRLLQRVCICWSL